jgi:hypothetical protein
MIIVETLTQKTCDVCRLLEDDLTDKLCTYCGLCDSWICKDCQPRWDRRARAATRRALEINYKGIKDVLKLFGAD